MTKQEVNEYFEGLKNRISLGRYVERRFTAADAGGGLPADFDYRFHGSFRDREPRLAELLTHPRVMVLAEPGGGKSITAYAAVLEILSKGERVPVLVELKEYRLDLSLLIRQSAPAELLKSAASVDGVPVHRTYVLDGVDEVPAELIHQFAADVRSLLKSDPNAHFFLTARQAFYVADGSLFSDIPAVFHILELTDEDIRQYVHQSQLEVSDFIDALRAADATEEVRNPFVLSVIVDRFQQSGGLSDRRSENISYMIDRLIQSRPRVSQHRQRRALRMLGVAMEVYSRSELTEDEALQIIKESMQVSDEDARAVLGELYGSILKRTVNGLAFQARSFGEYLAAEALEDEPLDRIQQLAFLDAKRPNDSWLNAISYLAELNASVRSHFVRRYPFWMIHPSPAVFSSEERDTVVSEILETLETEGQYATEHPQIQRTKLARLVTPAMGARLIGDLHSSSDTARGNALVLLGLQKRHEALPVALAIVKDRTLGIRLRYCALIAIVNAGGPAQVDELLPLLDCSDPLEMNLRDMIGAIEIHSEFAWEKLAELREKTLHMGLGNLSGIVTETLANINRKETASLMRRQIPIAPQGWRAAQQARATEQEQRARVEEAQQTPFDAVLRKLKRTTSINRLKLICEGSADEPVYKALLAQTPEPQDIIVDNVGGWPNLRGRDPQNLLLGCKEVFLVMDGDHGRHLKKKKKPFTEVAKQERRRLTGFPIEFHVLERYGIENYFPRSAMEKVLTLDLSSYFPIPDHVAVPEYFSVEYRTLRFQLRRLLALALRLKAPSPSRPLYSKSRNIEVATLISLDGDLLGTDLRSIVLRATQRAKELSTE